MNVRPIGATTVLDVEKKCVHFQKNLTFEENSFRTAPNRLKFPVMNFDSLKSVQSKIIIYGSTIENFTVIETGK